MKKFFLFLITTALVTFMFVSCEKEDDFFDESLLTGKWQSGTLFERYFDDGTGYTWDESDDVQESEAQNFTWTLVRSELTQNHILEITGTTVPKLYTITELNSAKLRYEDDFGKVYSFNRVD